MESNPRDNVPPLFVDGLNVDTLEPVRWVHRDQVWIPSNLASHQNLFRTLVALTNLTGETKYRDAARDAMAYMHIGEFLATFGFCPLGKWPSGGYADAGMYCPIRAAPCSLPAASRAPTSPRNPPDAGQRRRREGTGMPVPSCTP